MESDWIPSNGEKGTSPFLRPKADPDQSPSLGVHIGHRVDVASWPGETSTRQPYVTAAGPGLLTFTTFQAFNENVLSSTMI